MNAHFGNHIVRMYDDYDKMRKLASLVIVINPQQLGNAMFAVTMAAMVNELREVPPVPGVDKVMAPNDPQVAYRENCLVHGIPVAQGVYDYLVS